MKKKLIICLLLFGFSFASTYAVTVAPENVTGFQKSKHHHHAKHHMRRPHIKFPPHPHPRHPGHPRHPKHPPLPPHPHHK
ncbi:MAG: hypothetical protein ABJB11_17570 [Ferruginibacter sp.]